MRRAFLLLLSVSLALTPQSRKPKSNDPPDESDSLISRVSVGHKFATGIVWSPDGFLLFSDAPAGRILKITGEGKTVFREGLQGPQGLAFDDDGRVYICEARARRVIRVDKKGKVDVVAEAWEGKRLNGPNDVVVSKNGHVYFTDPAFASADMSRDLAFYGIYHVSPKGAMSLVSKLAGRPNGIALSPDGRLLYVVDSDNRSLLAYDVAKGGEVANERTLVKEISGVPDGVRTDKSGKLYIAAKEVAVYSPDGKLLRSIPVGEKPSAIAWGDGDQGTLYISARSSVFRLREQPEANH